MSKELYQKMAAQTAKEFGLPVPMFMALIDHESGWKMDARSSAGALGLGQVMPANLKNQGVSEAQYMKDPALQLNQAAFFYRDAIRQAKGDPVLGLAYYNASPKAVNRFISGKSGLPVKTANYVPTVLFGSQKFGGAPLSPQAVQEVKTKFGSRIADRTLQAKTGATYNPSTAYVDPREDPGLDAPSMYDTATNGGLSASATPQAVVPQEPAQQSMQQPEAVAQAPMPEIPTIKTEAINPKIQDVASGEFDLNMALGLQPEQPKHQYPDWFARMVRSEVEAA